MKKRKERKKNSTKRSKTVTQEARFPVSLPMERLITITMPETIIELGVSAVSTVLPGRWLLERQRFSHRDGRYAPRHRADEGVTNARNAMQIGPLSLSLILLPLCARTSQSAGCLRRCNAMLLLTSLSYYDITVPRAAAITGPDSLPPGVRFGITR